MDNIFGAPTETEDDLKQSINFYNITKPDRILPFWLTYYPKTHIIKYAKESNILSDEDIEMLEEGYIGLTHLTGSVKKEKIALYAKYQLLFQLRILFPNDITYNLFSKILMFFPYKRSISKFIMFLNQIKSGDSKFFYVLSQLFEKKNTP